MANNSAYVGRVEGNLYVAGEIVVNNYGGSSSTTFYCKDLFCLGTLTINGSLTYSGSSYLPLETAVFPKALNLTTTNFTIDGNLVVTGNIYNTVYQTSNTVPSFSFRGENSLIKYVNLVQSPPIIGAVQKWQTYEIPGRNGVVYFTWQDFAPFEVTAECYFNMEITTFQNISAWLQGQGKLVLPDNTDYYYLATVIQAKEYRRILGVFRGFDVTFLCQPFAYFVDGNSPFTISGTSTYSKTNPGNVYSQPLITITGNGNSGTIVITDTESDNYGLGQQIIEIWSADTGTVIDSELYSAYLGNTNVSSDLSAFPLIPPGNYTIRLTGGITSITIDPRYRAI